MDLSDSDLRELIRDAIAKRSQKSSHPGSEPEPFAAFRAHLSYSVFPLARGGDQDGQCLIEPAVRCNHCGYCLSYGH